MFWKFYWAFRDVGETPRIIGKMTNVWRLVFLSIIWLLATLCNTLITFRENHWLLRLIWRFSESVSEYESVFRICLWIIIHKFELLSEQLKGNIYVLIFSETNIDDSFPVGQFLIEGFCTLYRLDRNSKGGGIFLGKTFLQI